ncbi:hypothetical protein ACETU7_29695 [Rhodococcus sp. 3Y1]
MSRALHSRTGDRGSVGTDDADLGEAGGLRLGEAERRLIEDRFPIGDAQDDLVGDEGERVIRLVRGVSSEGSGSSRTCGPLPRFTATLVGSDGRVPSPG